MDKIGYLRILGIPEIDNVNRAKLLKETTRIFEDKDGSMLDLYLVIKKESILLSDNNIVNMCLANTNTSLDFIKSYRKMLDTLDYILEKLQSKGLKSDEICSFSRKLLIEHNLCCIADTIELLQWYSDNKNSLEIKTYG